MTSDHQKISAAEQFVERYGAQATLDTTTGEIQNITSESLEGKFTSIQIGIKTLGGTKYKPTPRVMVYSLYYSEQTNKLSFCNVEYMQ